MAQRRRRHVRRDVLVFLGSLAAHIGLFFLLSSEFRFYPPPEETQPAVQVEIVPEVPEPIPPIPPPKPVPIPKPVPAPKAAPVPQPVPPPQPQPPQPAPKPVVVKAPQPLTAKPAPTPAAPVKLAPAPSPAPAPKLANLPSPLPPPTPAPQPGPPQSVPRSSLVQPQPQIVTARHLILHKSQDQGAPLAAPVSIPGATFAPSPTQAASGAPASPGAGAAGGGAGGLPGGVLPRFGGGLRGSLIGCANAEAVHLTREEQARCDEAFGADAARSPQMSAIDASRRRDLDHQAASEASAQKYRDSGPSGAWNAPQAGQPRDGQSPGSQ
jgi:hypothetical protein